MRQPLYSAGPPWVGSAARALAPSGHAATPRAGYRRGRPNPDTDRRLVPTFAADMLRSSEEQRGWVGTNPKSSPQWCLSSSATNSCAWAVSTTARSRRPCRAREDPRPREHVESSVRRAAGRLWRVPKTEGRPLEVAPSRCR